jgi:sensor c-di-GMP phosphodiesterase-like protein
VALVDADQRRLVLNEVTTTAWSVYYGINIDGGSPVISHLMDDDCFWSYDVNQRSQRYRERLQIAVARYNMFRDHRHGSENYSTELGVSLARDVVNEIGYIRPVGCSEDVRFFDMFLAQYL